MIKHIFQRGLLNGARYGLREGLTKTFDYTEPSPPCIDNEQGFGDNAIMVVMALASVLVALMLTATILGLFSKSATNIGMNAAFNASIGKLDTNAQSAYSLAGVVPIVVISVGVLSVVIGVFYAQ